MKFNAIKVNMLNEIKKIIPDKVYLKHSYKRIMGKPLNLDNPVTFNEKLQWLKLYDRKAVYTTMVDKYAVKQYVANLIGNQYIIPTLGVWNNFDDIDFDKLPNEFVLKCTHDSGGVIICKDKNNFDKEKAKDKIEKCLKNNFYYMGREWPYKDVPHRIIAEKYMEDDSGELQDYKVFNYNGIPRQILVCRDRFLKSGLTEDFFNTEWKHLDIKRPHHNNSSNEISAPINLKEMLELSAKLSHDIPFLRTDFYEVGNKLYFGELTFYPASGFDGFEPGEWDSKLGNLIKLPENMGGGYLLISDNYFLYIHGDVANTKGGLKDYKFFCFDGKPKIFKIDFDRFNGHRANYYSCVNNEILAFGERDFPPDYNRYIQLPYNIELMKRLAGTLSSGTKFLRVDFYETNNKVYFGELTFYPASGFGKFTDDKWDKIMGDWIEL